MKISQENGVINIDVSDTHLDEQSLMNLRKSLESTLLTELSQIDMADVSGGSALPRKKYDPRKFNPPWGNVMGMMPIRTVEWPPSKPRV